MIELQQALDHELDGEVLFDDYTRHLFSRDASMYAITPVGVVAPRHAGDVVTAVRIAGEHGVPVLPRGGGTSLAGQTVGEALVLESSSSTRRRAPRACNPAWCRTSSTAPPPRTGCCSGRTPRRPTGPRSAA
jgi:FAD/FMN-containing dehydrogenase